MFFKSAGVVYCDLCQAMCANAEQLVQHWGGKKCAKNQKAVMASEQSPELPLYIDTSTLLLFSPGFDWPKGYNETYAFYVAAACGSLRAADLERGASSDSEAEGLVFDGDGGDGGDFCGL